MKKPKTIYGIAWLMIISQCLLLVFVIHWLNGQYATEKAGLKKELNGIMVASDQQVMDTLLLTRVINPMLHKQDSVQIRIEINADSTMPGLPKAGTGNYFRKQTLKNGGQEVISVVSGDSSFSGLDRKLPHIVGKSFFSGKPDSSFGLFTRELELLLAQEMKEKNKGHSIRQAISGNKSDTLLFKKILSANLGKNGLVFTTLHVLFRGADTAGINSPIYLESHLYDQARILEVSGFQFFLFRKLVPQLLFALVLLIFTAVAFWISFRSLRNQLKLSAMKDDLISNMTHELKTPVATVKLSLEALQQFDALRKPETMKAYLQMASIETERLEVLIAKVLNSTLLEEGGQLLHPELSDLRELTEEVVVSFRLRFEQREIQVKIRSEGNPVPVSIDKTHVRGVLMNLLDNALKYGPPGMQINLVITGKGNGTTLEVNDQGPGIPEEYLEKVSEKFFRVPDGNLHTVKGYGLGLNYAAQIMKLHGGTISLKNRGEGGLSVILYFPGTR